MRKACVSHFPDIFDAVDQTFQRWLRERPQAMPHAQKYLVVTVGTLVILMVLLVCFAANVNGVYGQDTEGMQKRIAFLKSIHLAAPVLATAGRNIAFESGNAASNAPASYLTMLDCCESDEAIADRIAVSQTTSRIIKRSREN